MIEPQNRSAQQKRQERNCSEERLVNRNQPAPTDRRLFAAFLDGAEGAFDSFYKRHNQPLFLYCARMLGNHSRAEDIAQETWLRIIRYANKPEKKPVEYPLPFIYRIAKNLCLNSIRDNKKRAFEGNADLEQLPSKVTEGSDRTESLNDALQQIPVKYREVLVLNAYVGYNFEEIAEMLGISKATAWKRASRGRKKIRKLLETEIGSELEGATR